MPAKNTEIQVEFRVTGVYMIRNIVTGNLYIGSSAECIRGRWLDHISYLDAKRHQNKYLWHRGAPTRSVTLFLFSAAHTSPVRRFAAGDDSMSTDSSFVPRRTSAVQGKKAKEQ